MRIRVRLFARVRDIVGASELLREVANGATLRTVWQDLVQEFPELERYGPLISGARNEEYVRMDMPVEEGDEVAFLPPVSGG
ncbi:MAG: MoaD/ThiS family protein [Acidobacteriota bacterium]